MNSNIRRFATALTLTVVLAAAGTATAAPRDNRDEPRTKEPRLILIIKKLFGISVTSDLPSIPIPNSSR